MNFSHSKTRIIIEENLDTSSIESDKADKKTETLIYAAGAILARQTSVFDTSGNQIGYVQFEQWDSSGMSYRRTNALGTFAVDNAGESDPTGSGVGLDGVAYFEANQPPRPDFSLQQPRGVDEIIVYQDGQRVICYENDFPTSCSRARRNLENGSSLPQGLAHLQGRPGFSFESYGFGNFRASYILPRNNEDTPLPPLNQVRNQDQRVYQDYFWDARQQPQQPRGDEVSFRDNKDAKSALSEVLAKGDCAKKLQMLFENLQQLNPNAGFANPVRNTDILKLFDDLAGQQKGGFFFNSSLSEANAKSLELDPNGNPGIGGGGLTFDEPIGHSRSGSPIRGQGTYMYVYVFPRYASTSSKRNIALARRALVSILIHEIAHAAGKNATFSHLELNKAAKAADAEIAKRNLGKGTQSGVYFDAFILKHCRVGFELQP